MWFNDLFESAVDPSEYGYWISPQGGIFPVDFQSHDEVINHLVPGLHDHDASGVALRRGWIRVIHHPHPKSFPDLYKLIVNFVVGKVSKDALRALHRVATTYNFSGYEVELEGAVTPELPTFKKFENFAPCWSHIRGAAEAPDFAPVAEALTEGRVPPTPYGYWITDKGEAIPVPRYGHQNVAYQHGFDGHLGCIKQGWIRVVSKEPQFEYQTKTTEGGLRAKLSIQFLAGKLTPQALSTLRLLARRGFDIFYVDVVKLRMIGGIEDYDTLEGKEFRSAEQMLAFVSQARDFEPLPQPINEAAEIPPTEYGYWIDPQGTFHVVGFQQHGSVIRAVHAESREKSSWQPAYRDGWIRVGSNLKSHPGMLFVQYREHTLTARSLSAIRRLARSQDFHIFWLTVYEESGESTEKRFTEQGAFLRSVQEYARKPKSLTEADVPGTTYGYWITDKGEAIAVPYQSHGEVARAHGMGGYPTAFRAGWIRVIVEDNEYVEIFTAEMLPEATTSRAIAMLRRVVTYVGGGFETYLLSLIRKMEPDQPIITDEHRFDSPNHFLGGAAEEVANAVQQARTAVYAESVLEESAIPATRYGYWLDPNGRFIAVNDTQGHKEALASIYGQNWTKAFDDGWVRLVVRSHKGEPVLNAECRSRTCTGKQAVALRRLATSEEFKTFYLSFYDRADPELGYGKGFTQPGPFMQFFNRARQPLALEENAVPGSDYGYWVDPDGNIHAVGYQRHGAWLTHYTDLSVVEALFEGWVRIVTGASSDVPTFNCCFVAGKLTLRAVSAVQRIATDGDYHAFRVDAARTARSTESKSFDGVGRLMQFVRETGRASGPGPSDPHHTQP